MIHPLRILQSTTAAAALLAGLLPPALAQAPQPPQSAPAPQASPLQLRAATVYADDTFHVQVLQQFARDVQQASAGRVGMAVHSNGSLLKAAELLPAVREGKVEVGDVIMSSLSGEIPLLAIDSLPFIATTYDDARAMWNATRAAATQALAAKGLQILYTVPWQPQNLYSNKKIDGLKDLQGLRMRYYSPMTQRIAEVLGAQPVTVPISMQELARAIAGDQIDTMLTSSWAGAQARAWTRMRHYYKIGAWIPKTVVFMNKARFDALDPAVQKAVLGAARTAEERAWSQSQALDKTFEAELAANKVALERLDPAALRALDRVGEQLAKEWMKTAAPADVKLLTAYMIGRSSR